MKKLMIAAAIVCAAACANAAESIYWEFDGLVRTIDGKGLYCGDMTITCEALDYTKTFTASHGDFSFGEDIDYCEEGENYTFTLTVETATHSYLATSVGTCENPISSVHFDDDGTWTAVPEPTSGLLMLLGMAGLCLRRKQRG